jgi:hypothetical protein
MGRSSMVEIRLHGLNIPFIEVKSEERVWGIQRLNLYFFED